MTFIFYVRVRSNYFGLRLPGWGVALMAGVVFTLASGVLFYSGSFAASILRQNESQRLAQQELDIEEAEAGLLRSINNSRLDAATGRLGELYARTITLGTRGESLAEAVGFELPDPKKTELVAGAPVLEEAGSAAAN